MITPWPFMKARCWTLSWLEKIIQALNFSFYSKLPVWRYLAFGCFFHCYKKDCNPYWVYYYYITYTLYIIYTLYYYIRSDNMNQCEVKHHFAAVATVDVTHWFFHFTLHITFQLHQHNHHCIIELIISVNEAVMLLNTHRSKVCCTQSCVKN